MIRAGAVCLLGALALPAAGFTPDPPGDARRTARAEDGPGRYGVAIAPAAPMAAPPLRSITGQRSRSAWHSESVDAGALLDGLNAQLRDAGFAPVFECDTDGCGGFDFRIALPLLPMPDMFVDLGGFTYRAFARDDPEALASIMASQTAAGAFAQLTLILPIAAPPEAQAPDRTADTVGAAKPGSTVPLADAAPETGTDTPPGADTLVATLERDGRAVLEGLDFATGAAALSGPAPPALDALARWLGADPERRIVLVGHSDWTGAPAANVALSRARARAVAEALIAAGAQALQITVDGVGPFAPRAPNTTPEGRAANRRVEAVVLPPAR